MKIVEPEPPNISEFFHSTWKQQSWMNIAYLLICFPLGLIYFIALVTGISLGFGLLITVFGIFILMGVLWMVHGFNRMEAEITSTMLGFHIDRAPYRAQERGFWKKFKEILRNPATWKGLFYQFLRFPMGIFSFTLVVSLLASSIALIGTPFIYRLHWFNMEIPSHPRWEIDTFPEALGCLVAGLLLLHLSLFILNWLAWIYGKFAQLMLREN